MVIKLYISGISGNKEVKKKQQRVQMILDSKQINYEAIDITEPGKEKDKEFMQANGKVRENLGKHPLPPQIFNDEDFCGDYEDFDLANEVDELEKFLHIATNSKELENGSKFNEDTRSLNSDTFEFDTVSKTSTYDPYEYHTYKIKWDGVNGLEEQIIINTDNLTEESEKGEENPKSEVNGESEAVPPASEPSNENIAESKSETSNEAVPAPANEEEVPAGEKETVGEEGTATENPESGVEAEEDTKRVEEEEKEEEESEKPKEESEAEKGNEEESAREEGDEVEENVGNENEGEEEKGEEKEEKGDDEEQEEKEEEEEEEGGDDD